MPAHGYAQQSKSALAVDKSPVKLNATYSARPDDASILTVSVIEAKLRVDTSGFLRGMQVYS